VANVNIAYGTYTSLTATHLNTLANSATNGWQSAVISNLTTLALDYEIFVSLPMANTAPAAPAAVYVYAAPAIWTGSAWLFADQGTTTLPTGVEGTTTIAAVNNLQLVGVFAYGTQDMVIQGFALLSNAIGQTMPDGYSLIGINQSGATTGTGCVVAVKPIYNTVV
jgi:hypothetical protein